MEGYGSDIAPYITTIFNKGDYGIPSDPIRFDSQDLLEREAEYGKAGFQLQFMLNTQLSDLERFPLKVKDLLIMSTDLEKGPMEINWLPHPDRIAKELPNVAMAGDHMYYIAGSSQEFSEYTGSVMSIDPSGRGKDETSYAVVKILNGYLTVRRCGGLPGGYDDATLDKLARIAESEKVNAVIIEANFGDGMFEKLFQPVLFKYHKCSLEEVKHSIQKEKRIIDTIEPVMMRHKLIIDPDVILDDFQSVQKYETSMKMEKSLIYQLTRICHDRGALKHDDRLDALAIAVAFFTESLARDEQEGLRREREDRRQAEILRFQSHATGGPSKRSRKWNVLH